MLSDKCYRVIVQSVVEFSRGRGEILVGVGDTGWAQLAIESRSLVVIRLTAWSS